MSTPATKKKPTARATTVSALTKQAKAANTAKLKRDRSRVEALLALIERRKARVTEDFYDIGEALREILREELFRSLGFDSFDSMLLGRKVLGATQAYKLIKLVENLPRDEALRLGQEKAYALVAYAAATPEQDAPAELARADAKVGGKPLSKATRRDLEQATAQARARAPKKPPSPADRAKQKADRAVEASTRTLLRKAGIGRIDVKLEGDTVVVRFARNAVERLAPQ